MEKATKTISLLILFGSFLIIQSCSSGNKKDKKETIVDTTTATDPDSTGGQLVTAHFTSHDFPALYVEFSAITNLFNEPGLGNRRKVVFRFDFDGTVSQPNLTGYPAKQNGKYVSASRLTLSKLSFSETISTPFYLGNIELSWDEYKELRDGTNKGRYLILIPRKSTVATFTDVVTYYTDRSDVLPTSIKSIRPYAVGDELNPSPPRDPQ